MSTGDFRLIRAAKAFEKSMDKSSSLMEESMAETHTRWTTQSEHFVSEYIVKKHGKRGYDCLALLAEALSDLIDERGDFSSVDLMGLVHSILAKWSRSFLPPSRPWNKTEISKFGLLLNYPR